MENFRGNILKIIFDFVFVKQHMMPLRHPSRKKMSRLDNRLLGLYAHIKLTKNWPNQQILYVYSDSGIC